MEDYLNTESKGSFLEDIGSDRIYFAYIARGYSRNINIEEIRKKMNVHSEGFLFTSEAILRLLYYKIKLGKNFSLVKIKDLTS